VKETTMHGSIY